MQHSEIASDINFDGGTADVFLVSKTDIIELKEGVNTLPVGKWRVRMITEKASGIVVLKK